MPSLCCADDDMQYALQAAQQVPKQMAPYQLDVLKAEAREKEIIAQHSEDVKALSQQSEQKWLAQQNESQVAETKKPATNIVIFVSLSMPAESLQSYLRDAKKIHASVVIRGLVNNSFQQTFKQVAELIKSSGGDGIELNPIWFKQYHITQVPAVVVLPDHAVCASDQSCIEDREYDVITGNIVLSAALKQIRDKGVAATNEASVALEQLNTSRQL